MNEQEYLVDITGLDKAMVLVALVSGAEICNNGWMDKDCYKQLTLDKARKLLKEKDATYCHFDFVHGRAIKVTFNENNFSSFFYDRENGQGAAQNAVDRLRRLGFELPKKLSFWEKVKKLFSK